MTGRGPVAWLPLALLVGLALVLRVAFAVDFARNHPQADRPVIDAASYERWALEIADGDWVGDEVFFQEPLYPYALGAVYAVWPVGEDDPTEALAARRTAARGVQALLGAACVLLVALVTHRLFGAKAALVAALGLATYRPLLVFPALFLKPNLFLPVLALLVWLCLRARPLGDGARARSAALGWLAAGLVAGLGALLRGNMLLLLPFVLLLPFARARAAGASLATGLAPAALLLAGMAGALLPVAIRNHAVGGVFALTTSGAGTNLYGGNNAQNPYGRATEFDWVRGIPEHEADDWRHEAERRTGRTLDPGEVSSFWMGETWRSIRADPGLHLGILANKLRLTLGSYEVPDNHHLAWDERYVAALRLPFPGFGLWGVLGLAGALLFATRRWSGGPSPDELGGDARGAWELLVLALLYTATIVLTVTSMRVRLALVPLLVPFAGYLVAALLAPPRPLLGAGVALAAAALVVHVPVFDADERAADLLKRDYNLAVYRLEEGRLDEAEELARGLGERTVAARLLLAEVDYRRGLEARAAGAPAAELEADFDRALGLLRSILEGSGANARDRFRATKLAAFVFFEARNWDKAETRLRAALAFDPEDEDVLLRLANVLFVRAGEATGAERRALLTEARDVLLALVERFDTATLRARLAEVEAELAEAG